LDIATELIINKDFGACESSTTAISSVLDFDSVYPVLLVELNFPPLTNTCIGVGEFVSESIDGWV
jgi:hypothetical protein